MGEFCLRQWGAGTAAARRTRSSGLPKPGGLFFACRQPSVAYGNVALIFRTRAVRAGPSLKPRPAVTLCIGKELPENSAGEGPRRPPLVRGRKGIAPVVRPMNRAARKQPFELSRSRGFKHQKAALPPAAAFPRAAHRVVWCS